MANRFRQFRLLLWKNFILQIRRPIGTTFEILVPLVLVSILILPKLLLKPEDNCFETFAPLSSVQIKGALVQSQLKENLKDGQNVTANNSLVLAYYPIGYPVSSIMEKVSSITGFKVVNRSVVHKGKVFTTLDDIVSEVTEHEDRYQGVIVFDVEEGKSLPKKVKYTIRLPHKDWKTDRTYPNFQRTGARKSNEYKERFTPIQYAVDMAIIQEKTGSKFPIPLNIQQLPYPEYVVDRFALTVVGLLPLLLTLAFIYSAVSMIKFCYKDLFFVLQELVYEKQNRLKESMKMMGLANWIHWLAWYIKCLLFLLISVVLITAIVKGFKIFEYSNGFLVFLFFFLYVMSTISYCFFISVFFSNPTMSMLFGSVLWYAAYLPFQIFAQNEEYDQLNMNAKAAMCLLPNSAIGIGATLLSRLESLKIGLTFDNLNEPSSPDDTFTMAWVMGMMLISSVVFMIFTWYIEGIFPGKFGIPKPFYFPFQKSYWCGFSHDDIIEANAKHQELDEENEGHNHDVEDEPTDLEVGVGIKNLRKVFKSILRITIGIIIIIIMGIIIIIIMGIIIMGIIIIIIMGIIIMDIIVMGIIVMGIIGTYGQPAKEEVITMITHMQLLDKMNEKSSTLSGGMKRKLSCAIALVGGSETVFLDEPTSGMDPYARRATWDLLLKYKAGKTIILTTHYMDEADFLGDRIAIMADGQLRCCGSSLFLKSRYGVGYHLTLVKDAEKFNENVTINAIKRVVPSAEILSNVGAELEFVLNREAAKSFESLFLELETKKDDYGIASFGVSVTTMEEVFMKVGEGSEKTVEDIASDHQHHKDTENILDMPKKDPDMGELLKGFPLKWQQYKAMLIKRFLNSKRDKKAVVTQLLLPLVMVLFGLIIINSNPPQESEPPRLLTLSNLSTGDTNVHAFYADFNQPKKSMTWVFFQAAKDYLKTVKVDVKDVTDDVRAILSGNSNDSITVRGTSYSYTAPKDDKPTSCCDYEFLVLNPKCQSDFLNASLSVDTCSKNDKFGYKNCKSCLLNTNSQRSCKALTINKTTLLDMNMYFSEYVLEQSNAKNFFNTYVAGFTLAPLPKIIKPSNSSNSKIVMPSTMSTVWYSNQAFHTIAEAMNAMSNILLRQFPSFSDHLIETTNYPLPNTAKNKSEKASSGIGALFLSIFLSMGMSFMAASFIAFIVHERSSKAKHLQFVSGVDAVSYWLASYTWDYINYLIPSILVLVLIAAFQLEEFENDLGSVFLLLLLFGFCVLPFIYCLSFLFKSPLVAYALTVFILSILSLVMLIAVFICRIPGLNVEEEAEIMHYVFMLFPTYSLSIALTDMSSNYRTRKSCTESAESKAFCSLTNVKFSENPLAWDMPGVGQEAMFMFVEGVVLFILTILIQVPPYSFRGEGGKGMFCHVNFLIGIASKGSKEASDSNKHQSEDSDVYAERLRIDKLTKEQIDKEAVVIKDLTKVYSGSDMTAVDHLSIGIPRGQCFGLLGVNGAGKTTTFSMLTGDQSITEGSAYLDGYNIQTHLRQVHESHVGICSVVIFDALIERMTGREMLVMYAQLRGVQPSKINDIVSTTIENMNLGKWADKLCGNYSGGNKRKLSTAIALVGDPPIVFLDEPTSGMDPVARRFLWDSLSHVMKGGRSIILTSHSMEECEALCTRLAIMVNGQFKCVGSPQHLKSRFGSGYTMMIKVKGNNGNDSVATTSQVTPYIPSMSYENTAANDGLPEVCSPGHPISNPVAAAIPAINQPIPTNAEVEFQPVSPGSYPQQQSFPLGTEAAAVAKAKTFIEQTFQGAYLMESHSGMLTYQIINDNLTWSQIFGHLEKNRESLNIVDYSVSQTTLEQVFINFAKEQHSEERTKVKRKCGCLPC
ncbi:hypothetical protein QZH41_015277 [Actinostola sp. cb2023]|nr:hypothetical protein QZH41_015277 [Actinostola sp. cb2023]